MRTLLEHVIGNDPRLEVAASVGTAEEALRVMPTVRPDVISLDVRLPGMNGLDATRRIMSDHPTPIVIVSANVDGDDFKISMNALSAGAVTVVEKPVATTMQDYEALAERLCRQLAIMSDVRHPPAPRPRRHGRGPGSAAAARGQSRPPDYPAEPRGDYRVLGIVASTGGPSALVKLLGALGADFPLPVVLVQHITPSFMAGFISWLDEMVPLKVAAAEDGGIAIAGTVYVAPADRHLEVHGGRLKLVQGPAVSSQKPSGTVLLQSLARSYGRHALGWSSPAWETTGRRAWPRCARPAAIHRGGQVDRRHHGMPAVAVRLGGASEQLPCTRSDRGCCAWADHRRPSHEPAPSTPDPRRRGLRYPSAADAAPARARGHSGVARGDIGGGLDYLSRNRPDLIVVDYHLPGMRGDELCRQIRMNPATSDIMVLILTDDIQGVVERQGLGRRRRSSAEIDRHRRADGPHSGPAAQSAAPGARRPIPRPSSSSAIASWWSTTVRPTWSSPAARSRSMAAMSSPSTARRALAHLTRESCDCLIVDQMMPEMSGIELCQKLERYRARTGAWFPILMVTSRDSKDEMMRAFEAGVDDFIGKSSDIAILRARVRSLLRRKAQHDEHERIGSEFHNKELEVVRERAERQAAERRAEISVALEIRNRELRETQAQLIQAAKMASLGELVAGIAHEVNNPIAFVMSHLDTIGRNLDIVANVTQPMPERAQAGMEKARTRLAEAREGLERVKSLVLKLRTFSRLDEGESKRVDIRESIDSVLAMLRHQLRQGSVRAEIA